MMRKIALHWQILFAFVLAIIAGLLFPTRYVISESLDNPDIVTQLTIHQLSYLQTLATDTLSSEDTLYKLLETHNFAPEITNKVKKAAYFNPVINKIAWLGDIFIRLLKMIIIPLILTSIVSGVINMGSGQNLGRIGLKTFAYYIGTSIIAIFTGLFFVNIFKPGVGAQIGSRSIPEFSSHTTIQDTLMNIVPINIFEALSRGNMLSIIFFALLFGFFITKISIAHKHIMIKLFNAGFEVMMKITMFIIKFAPIGIFGIVAKVIADQSDLTGLMKTMGFYMLVILMGLFFHAFVSLPLIVKLIGRSKPYRHFKNMGTPLLTAFSTSSSSATLPLTIDAVENNSGVSNKVTSFTLPLGATINMDGTALYEIVVAMFIAQVLGVEISFGQQVLAALVALITSIGAAGIPMASLFMISVVLSTLGLPLDAIGLILAVDRILDMFRTAVNVWSDSCAAVVIAKTEGENLKV